MAHRPPPRRRPTAVASLAGAARLVVATSLLGAAWFAAAGRALAHAGGVPPAPGLDTLVTAWIFEPLVALPLLLSALAYLWLARRVDRDHAATPVPGSRVACFLGGLAAIAIALESPLAAYDTTLFSVHMVQHVLLIFVAAPLLVLGAPITLLLRAASHERRTRHLLPVLHSRALRVLTFPVVSWLVFAGVMWGTHFSPLFDASLEEPVVHDLEHLLFVVAALLFWWPAIGRDPSPWRIPHPARILYVFLQMPQNTFLALVIFSANTPLYAHYATLIREWGPTVLSDQQGAGAIMWVAGDLTFLAAILGIVVAWMRDEERTTARREVRTDLERAAIREREARLAERLALEAQAGIGADR